DVGRYALEKAALSDPLCPVLKTCQCPLFKRYVSLNVEWIIPILSGELFSLPLLSETKPEHTGQLATTYPWKPPSFRVRETTGKQKNRQRESFDLRCIGCHKEIIPRRMSLFHFA